MYVLLLAVLLLVLGRVSAAASVTASPANNTAALTQRYGTLRWLLTDSHAAFPTEIDLAPLTVSLASLDYEEFQSSRLVGALLDTTASNAASVSSQDISLISCDPFAYDGYLDVAETVSDVVSLSNGGPVAVILYSVQSDYCNYTVNDPTATYSSVFTILTPSSAQAVLDHLNDTANSTASTTTAAAASSSSTSTASAAAVTATIVANMSTSTGAYVGSSSTNSSSPGDGQSSSTTAVAMIILYTITGIITALFLGIIITGAVRAHRHPERYGPRNVTGRPRQSRARGVARAMLETIPIVKFGDSPDHSVDAAKRDVEMATRNEEDADHATATATATATEQHAGQTPTSNAGETGTADETRASEQVAQSPQSETDSVTANPESETAAVVATSPHQNAADTSNNSCPICTDDFVKGQDVRVLPCGHQFHPECIDPWLINVSGTCPLCRIDLNPASSDAANGQADENEGAEHEHENENAEGEAAVVSDTHPQSPTRSRSNTLNANHNNGTRPVSYRGLGAYLSDMRDVRRARNAPVEERIEALRRLRQSNMDANASNTNPNIEESQGRRRHLTTRLRDRFRVRTRQHGSPSASDDQAQSPPSPSSPS